jgi:hypothetical protein
VEDTADTSSDDSGDDTSQESDSIADDGAAKNATHGSVQPASTAASKKAARDAANQQRQEQKAQRQEQKVQRQKQTAERQNSNSTSGSGSDGTKAAAQTTNGQPTGSTNTTTVLQEVKPASSPAPARPQQALSVPLPVALEKAAAQVATPEQATYVTVGIPLQGMQGGGRGGDTQHPLACHHCHRLPQEPSGLATICNSIDSKTLEEIQRHSGSHIMLAHMCAPQLLPCVAHRHVAMVLPFLKCWPPLPLIAAPRTGS